MGGRNWQHLAKKIGVVFIVFCVLFTSVIGGIALLNAADVGRLARVVQLVQSEYLEGATTDQLVEGATKGIVDSLEDPYSAYMNKEENQQLFEMLEGKFGGIGIILSLKDPEKLTVLRPIKNTPAERAGILPGDVVVKIDEVETSTIDQDKAVSLMRGDPGTEVTLVLYRASEEREVTVALTREIINVPTVEGKAVPGHDNLAYVNISQFSSETGNELTRTLGELGIEKYDGMILDLRYNHGGELNAAVQVASYFVPSGPVVYIVDKNNQVDTKMATGTYLGIPLVVLVNEESASASEIVAGAIKDSGTGTLVGEKTFGKGIVQTIFPLSDGTSVKLTTAKYLTPSKADIHKIGIEPDVKVSLPKGQEATLSPTDTKFDPQLQKAIEVLEEETK